MPPQRFVIPEVAATNFHLREGDVVGDFGAGSGHFLPVLSRLVGAEGKVYALEIQKNLVENLEAKVRQEHLSNVEVVWGDFEEIGASKLEDGSLDAAVIVNALFQSDDKVTAVQEIVRTLRSGGKLLLIDWYESWAGLGPQSGNVLSADEAKSTIESQGLTLERTFDAGDHHYGLAFRKS